MRAITVQPGKPGSQRLDDLPEPPGGQGGVLVLGHESLGRVISAPGSIVCLTGLGGGQRDASFDVARFNQSMVLENRVVFDSVNANLRHYHAAADALAHANRGWLDRVITRRVSFERWEEAYEKREDDVKTVLLLED